MQDIRHLTPSHAEYPERVRAISKRPKHLSLRGPVERAYAVAIVGARKAHDDAARYAHELAYTIAQCGIVVISGGAVGIDAAAHRGAMAAGGRTWAVAGTGCNHVFPSAHADLYDAIVKSGGAMIWPFVPTTDSSEGWTFRFRNRVLVALADVVVVVQASQKSGALNAAACARELDRPLWVVPGMPWVKDFEGGGALVDAAASGRDFANGKVRALTSTSTFLKSIGIETGPLSAPARRISSLPAGLSDAEKAMAKAASGEPKHIDELTTLSGLTASAAATALLTLALEDVVVEGPGGFFRRTGP